MTFDLSGELRFLKYALGSALGNEPDEEKGIQDVVDDADTSERSREHYRASLEALLKDPGLSCKDLLYRWTNRSAPTDEDARRWFANLWGRIFGFPSPVRFLCGQLLSILEHEPDEGRAIRTMRQVVEQDQGARELCMRAFARILNDPRFSCQELLHDYANRDAPSEEEARSWLAWLRDRLLTDAGGEK